MVYNIHEQIELNSLSKKISLFIDTIEQFNNSYKENILILSLKSTIQGLLSGNAKFWETIRNYTSEKNSEVRYILNLAKDFSKYWLDVELIEVPIDIFTSWVVLKDKKIILTITNIELFQEFLNDNLEDWNKLLDLIATQLNNYSYIVDFPLDRDKLIVTETKKVTANLQNLSRLNWITNKNILNNLYLYNSWDFTYKNIWDKYISSKNKCLSRLTNCENIDYQVLVENWKKIIKIYNLLTHSKIPKKILSEYQNILLGYIDVLNNYIECNFPKTTALYNNNKSDACYYENDWYDILRLLKLINDFKEKIKPVN